MSEWAYKLMEDNVANRLNHKVKWVFFLMMLKLAIAVWALVLAHKYWFLSNKTNNIAYKAESSIIALLSADRFNNRNIAIRCNTKGNAIHICDIP